MQQKIGPETPLRETRTSAWRCNQGVYLRRSKSTRSDAEEAGPLSAGMGPANLQVFCLDNWQDCVTYRSHYQRANALV